MTACQKIKREIIIWALENFKEYPDNLSDKDKVFLALADKQDITENTVDEQYDALVETGNHWDILSEFRPGQLETKLPSDYSRHYEAKEVARKLSDNTWVGWTYWYGGGKHGDPDSVPWMEDAYELDVTETEKMVLVREFKKKA